LTLGSLKIESKSKQAPGNRGKKGVYEMNYICTDCGHIFEEGEETIKHYDGEDWACCPSCGSTEIVDGVRCKDCGRVVEEDTLFDGWCKECLLEKLADYDLFFEYLTEGDTSGFVQNSHKVTGLEEFVFTALWGLPEGCIPSESSFHMKNDLKDAYYKYVSYYGISIGAGCHERNRIVDWMTHNETHDLYDFAEWLNERERKKVKA
jgi:DNA-directed RNA polymerase subunit RPC12/RpoP